MEKIQIEKVTIHQVEPLQAISKNTFWETFAEQNSLENMTQYLETGFSLEKLTAELNDPNAAFYFAWRNQEVIGYLKLNFGAAQTELKDQNALEIERIYVLKAFHGRKVGQLLYEKAIQIAKQMQARYVWLGVWEENRRAIHFYEKNGFVTFDKHIFILGDDKQIDLMMKLQLE
jgi:ribosomal protein S18 acetylase RimI-like enzyme